MPRPIHTSGWIKAVFMPHFTRWFLTGCDSGPQETFGSVWRHSGSSRTVSTEYLLSSGRGRPGMLLKILLHPKNHRGSRGDSAEAENTPVSPPVVPPALISGVKLLHPAKSSLVSGLLTALLRQGRQDTCLLFICFAFFQAWAKSD